MEEASISEQGRFVRLLCEPRPDYPEWRTSFREEGLTYELLAKSNAYNGLALIGKKFSMPNRYYHEIWLCPDENGQQLPSCISLGPSGDAARNLNESGSECIWIFWATSHIEAMQIYYDFLDFGTYRTEFPEDSEPYPDAWIAEQHAYLSAHKNGQG
ncbi:hypothetical protein ACEN9D_27205 [Pseudomonas sp. CT11-2]|uniref:hypothetical protein n=1 Tax=unclassified Pseudomonas TaxID=196821 RepID=UPI00215EAF3B|nr:hypothetical protein [Pseudomonas sp. B21-019]UVM34965.1 hypothetical protein LOY36_09755 [Pseudomonas sp. B21-019]